MSLIKTKELFDEFFTNYHSEAAKTNRTMVDRPEVYAYEEKIGKQLVDMSVDELLEMLRTFHDTQRKNTNFMIGHSSYEQISSLFRQIFNYYIDHYEVIKNPFYDSRMRGREAIKYLAQGTEPMTWSYVEDIISKIHRDYAQDKADYIECIMQLYYNGFSCAEDIIYLKENMIDVRNRRIMFQGRTTQTLSKRCWELLHQVHNMTKLDGWRGDYLMKEWRGGYFKYPIRPKQESELDKRGYMEMAAQVNRYITTNVNRKYDTKLNYYTLFMLGFHDFVAKQIGAERTMKLMTSYRVSEDAEELMGYARDYGLNIGNISHLKRALRPFIGGQYE